MYHARCVVSRMALLLKFLIHFDLLGFDGGARLSISSDCAFVRSSYSGTVLLRFTVIYGGCLEPSWIILTYPILKDILTNFSLRAPA